MRAALTHHRSGRLPEAEQIYREVLRAEPAHAEAHHNLGVLALQTGRTEIALAHLKAALEAAPHHEQFLLSYAGALIDGRCLDEASAVLAEGQRRGFQGETVNALAERVNAARAAGARGGEDPSPAALEHVSALLQQGRHAESESAARALTRSHPRSGFAWKWLAVALAQMGFGEEAAQAMGLAADLLHDPESYYNLGALLHAQGKSLEAKASYRRAIDLRPDFVEAHNNLGGVRKNLGRLEDAEASFRRVLELRPENADAHFNLGVVLQDAVRLAESEACYRRAIAICPDHAGAHFNLGVVAQDQGRLRDAESAYRRALEIKPDWPKAHSNLLFAINHDARHDQAHCLDDARRYGRMASARASGRFTTWTCERFPQRLRVGVVSGDLKNHPVGYFLEALLSNLDPRRLELFAYPTDVAQDTLTTRLRARFAAWRPIDQLGDEAAARLIHADGVHVLLDLAGHTANNRLPVFAWKPAPVQITWLGYFATTGMPEMDFILGDPYVTPPGEEHHFSERVWRMPERYLCFTPPAPQLEVAPLPAMASGIITFGCFNNLSKMNDEVLETWARLLRAMPSARLFLKSRQLGVASVRDETARRFHASGVAPSRLLLEGASPRTEYLRAYDRVDIALDPFPYPGGTTTVEGLWMGVPCITRRGDRFVAHMGESIAHNAGLPEWVAGDDADYVARALSFAADLGRLGALRATLRARVSASPLLDAPLFARRFESALWEMWERKEDNGRAAAAWHAQ